MLKRLTENRRGSIMVELALTVPLAFILCVGAADFARLFYHALTIKGASSGAALLGAQDPLISGGNPGLEVRATSDADNLAGVTAVPTQICQCPNAAPFSCQDYAATTCAGYGAPRAYVRVQVNQDFRTLGYYPGVPNQTNIREATWMRVQ